MGFGLKKFRAKAFFFASQTSDRSRGWRFFSKFSEGDFLQYSRFQTAPVQNNFTAQSTRNRRRRAGKSLKYADFPHS